MPPPYLERFFRKLLSEMGEFVSGQQMLTAALLALLAFWYQYLSGKLSLAAFKGNAATVVYPFVWVVCAFGCYYVVKAAIHLHREMRAEIEAYRPAILEYKPKVPSVTRSVLTAAVMICFFAVVSSETFIAAFPGRVTAASLPSSPVSTLPVPVPAVPSDSPGLPASAGHSPDKEQAKAPKEKTPPSRRPNTIQHGEARLEHIENVPSPALVIVNPASEIVHNVKYMVGIWNMDLPERIDPLPIPVATIDFIRPGEDTGPLHIFGSLSVLPLIKTNDRLYGCISIDSPDWDSGITYVVYVIGPGGWYAELDRGGYGRGKLPVPGTPPPGFTVKDAIQSYFKSLDTLVPENLRRPIHQ